MFTIYSKAGCTFCEKIVQFLEENHLPHEKLSLGEDYDREEFIDRFGQTTFPRVLHNGELVGGMQETVKYIVRNKLI